MATTTPNFGWPVPTSTDLVKDGATAIEALGDSIDASLLDLKGGTSGQVLSKNSNTDMDFTWVTSDDANAIQNTIVDAKGDLIGATAADTPARLAVGTNGQVLTADSTAATGLKWAAPSGGALILTGSADFTTSSAVNINNCFSATYLNYLVLINLTAVSATDSDLSVRLRVGGADNSAASYFDNTYQNNGSSAGGNRVNSATSWAFGNMASSKATQLATQATFYDPFSSITTKVLSQSNRWNSSDNNQFIMVNEHRVASSFDGVSFIPTSGTISGKIRIYGYTLS
jgi:hypothetical protein